MLLSIAITAALAYAPSPATSRLQTRTFANALSPRQTQIVAQPRMGIATIAAGANLATLGE